MKGRGKLLLFIVVVFLCFKYSEAVPSFARQMNTSCNTCHSPHSFPSLNSYGRFFKASGYTQIRQPTIKEADFLSIPKVLNLSIVAKLKVTGESRKVNRDEIFERRIQLPDEWTLFSGGRISKNVGYIAEGAADAFTLRIPFVIGTKKNYFGIVPYTTYTLGAPAVFEVMNTGAISNLVILETSEVISAQQYIGTGTPATGIGFYYYSNLFYVTGALWAPFYGRDITTLDIKELSNYGRVAFTPNVAGWDIGVGLQYWGGKTVVRNNTGETIIVNSPVGSISIDPGKEESLFTRALALDFQAMGYIRNIPLGVFLTYGQSPLSKTGEPTNIFNTNPQLEKTVITGLVELGVIPDIINVSLGYRKARNEGRDDNAYIFGAKYHLHRNVQFQVNYISETDRKASTFMSMLYTAF